MSIIAAPFYPKANQTKPVLMQVYRMPAVKTIGVK
jgi:hypothetical protein